MCNFIVFPDDIVMFEQYKAFKIAIYCMKEERIVLLWPKLCPLQIS